MNAKDLIQLTEKLDAAFKHNSSEKLTDTVFISVKNENYTVKIVPEHKKEQFNTIISDNHDYSILMKDENQMIIDKFVTKLLKREQSRIHIRDVELDEYDKAEIRKSVTKQLKPYICDLIAVEDEDNLVPIQVNFNEFQYKTLYNVDNSQLLSSTEAQLDDERAEYLLSYMAYWLDNAAIKETINTLKGIDKLYSIIK